MACPLSLVLLSSCSVLSVLLHTLALSSSPTPLPAPRDRAGSPPASGSIFPPNSCEFLTAEDCGALSSHSSGSLSRRHGFSSLQLHAPGEEQGRPLPTFCLYEEAERQPREEFYFKWHAQTRNGLTQFSGIPSQILSTSPRFPHSCLTYLSGKSAMREHSQHVRQYRGKNTIQREIRLRCDAGNFPLPSGLSI